MLISLFIFIFIISFYIKFSRIHIHDIIICQFKTMKKEVKVQREEDRDGKIFNVEKVIEKYNVLEIVLFYLLPLLIILINIFFNGIILTKPEDSLGNIGTIVSIFSGFLFNAVLTIEQKQKRNNESCIKEVYYNINYALLVSFFLLIAIAVGFYFYNIFLENVIFFLLIHFVFSILLVFNLLFSLNKPS